MLTKQLFVSGNLFIMGIHQVLELHFDPDIETMLVKCRQAISSAVFPAQQGSNDIAPHLSLTSSEGNAVLSQIDGVGALCSSRNILRIDFSYAGLFSGRGKTLFLGVTPAPELLDFHRELHDLLCASGIKQAAFMQPGTFVPHCSLATNMTDKQALKALSIVMEAELPCQAVAKTLHLVEYYPVRTLSVLPLKEGQIT